MRSAAFVNARSVAGRVLGRWGRAAGVSLFGLPSSVGLDLGSHTLKAAEVAFLAGDFRVTRIGVAQTPPGAVSKGVVANPEALAPAIRNLLQEAGIRSKRVVAALGGQAVFIRVLTLPEMPEVELEQAVTLEAERYLPEGVYEVSHNYQVQARIPEEGQLEILLVAAAKGLIDRHLAPLEMMGLAPLVMEVTPFSAVRAVARRNSESDGATVYVDIGAESSDILILDNERVRLARNIPIGGNAVTTGIAEAMTLDVAAAEALKKQRAEMVLDGEQLDDMTLRKLHQAILPVITRISTELSRSLDFYLTRSRGQAISKVVLTGGTGKLKSLAPFLSTHLGLPVEIGNPFVMCAADASFPPEYLAEVAPVMAVAVGLALRGAHA